MDIAVYVATTAGPVRVERIVGEDAPLSQVYQGRTYRPLEPVSADYARFAGNAGPVALAFGPFTDKSFRLEVAQSIGSGNSWELAFFIAHGLAKAGRLAAPNATPSQAIILTGRVDIDLHVGAVGHLADKLEAARPFVADCRARSIPVTFFAPVAEAEIADAGGIDLVGVADAPEVMKAILPGLPEKPVAAKPTGMSWRRRGAVAGIVALIVVGIGISVNIDRMELKLPDADAPEIAIAERRAPSGHTCAEVQFSGMPALKVPVVRSADGTLLPSRLVNLCGLSFSVHWRPADHYGEAWLEVLSGRYIETVDSSHAVGDVVSIDPDHPWDIDLPRHLDAPFAYRLVIVVAPTPVAADLTAYRNAADRDKVKAQLAEKGAAVLSLEHRVEP